MQDKLTNNKYVSVGTGDISRSCSYPCSYSHELPNDPRFLQVSNKSSQLFILYFHSLYLSTLSNSLYNRNVQCA